MVHGVDHANKRGLRLLASVVGFSSNIRISELVFSNWFLVLGFGRHNHNPFYPHDQHSRPQKPTYPPDFDLCQSGQSNHLLDSWLISDPDRSSSRKLANHNGVWRWEINVATPPLPRSALVEENFLRFHTRAKTRAKSPRFFTPHLSLLSSGQQSSFGNLQAWVTILLTKKQSHRRPVPSQEYDARSPSRTTPSQPPQTWHSSSPSPESTSRVTLSKNPRCRAHFEARVCPRTTTLIVNPLSFYLWCQ